MSPAQLDAIRAECTGKPRGVAGRVDAVDVLRLIEERTELLDAVNGARAVMWHRSRCPAHDAGCGDQPCNCGFDAADEAADDAIKHAEAP